MSWHNQNTILYLLSFSSRHINIKIRTIQYYFFKMVNNLVYVHSLKEATYFFILVLE